MPTPPDNLAPICDRFSHVIDKCKGQIVKNLDAPKRERNLALLAKVRKQGRCEWPTCKNFRMAFIDPHHIKTRATGGGDVDENVIGLCRECHTKAHTGLIPKTALLAIIAERK